MSVRMVPNKKDDIMSRLTSLPQDILRYILEEFASASTLSALKCVSVTLSTHASIVSTRLRCKYYMQVLETCRVRRRVLASQPFVITIDDALSQRARVATGRPVDRNHVISGSGA